MTSKNAFAGLRQQGRIRLRVVPAPEGSAADALLVAWLGRRPAAVAGIRRRGAVAVVGPVTLRPFARWFGIEAALHAFGRDVARRAGAHRDPIGRGPFADAARELTAAARSFRSRPSRYRFRVRFYVAHTVRAPRRSRWLENRVEVAS